uniref:Uncharacterized protein n=1 Tax=Arundo donax TaxID=35708 RepID=A0A0A8YFT6_ARUDO
MSKLSINILTVFSCMWNALLVV